MIKDDDNILKVAEKHLKDIDGIKSGTESSVLGVSLKQASESLKYLSNALSTLYGKIKKGGK